MTLLSNWTVIFTNDCPYLIPTQLHRFYQGKLAQFLLVGTFDYLGIERGYADSEKRDNCTDPLSGIGFDFKAQSFVGRQCGIYSNRAAA